MIWLRLQTKYFKFKYLLATFNFLNLTYYFNLYASSSNFCHTQFSLAYLYVATFTPLCTTSLAFLSFSDWPIHLNVAFLVINTAPNKIDNIYLLVFLSDAVYQL